MLRKACKFQLMIRGSLIFPALKKERQSPNVWQLFRCTDQGGPPKKVTS